MLLNLDVMEHPLRNRRDSIASPPTAGEAGSATGGWELFRRHAASIAPGLLLSLVIAATAYYGLQFFQVANISPLVAATVLGLIVGNVFSVPDTARPGLLFCQQRILRFGIVLLGLQITAPQLLELGVTSLSIVAASLAATFVFTIGVGSLLGVDRALVKLIAAGTSICGASAVIACHSVIRGRDENVAYAIACVTLLGTVSMLVYPLLADVLRLNAQAYGVWAGASIHEVGQVVGAAFQNGAAAGEAGTVAKLARVLMLAPMLLLLAQVSRRRGAMEGGVASPPLPLFVFGFMAMIALNSMVAIPDEVGAVVADGTSFLFTIALAALGLNIEIGRIRSIGLRPLFLAALSTLFISGFSLALVGLLG